MTIRQTYDLVQRISGQPTIPHLLLLFFFVANPVRHYISNSCVMHRRSRSVASTDLIGNAELPLTGVNYSATVTMSALHSEADLYFSLSDRCRDFRLRPEPDIAEAARI